MHCYTCLGCVHEDISFFAMPPMTQRTLLLENGLSSQVPMVKAAYVHTGDIEDTGTAALKPLDDSEWNWVEHHGYQHFPILVDIEFQALGYSLC